MKGLSYDFEYLTSWNERKTKSLVSKHFKLDINSSEFIFQVQNGVDQAILLITTMILAHPKRLISVVGITTTAPIAYLRGRRGLISLMTHITPGMRT